MRCSHSIIVVPGWGFASAHELQSRTELFVLSCSSFSRFHSCASFGPASSILELYIRPERGAGVTFVVLDFKRESLTFHMRHQHQLGNGTFGRYMPWRTGIAAFLEIKNHEAADFSVRVFNLEIDPWEVIHFPFPGSGERRLRVNWHGRFEEKEYYKACQCGDDRHLVGFHVLTLNNKTIESRGFVYRTRDSVVGGSQQNGSNVLPMRSNPFEVAQRSRSDEVPSQSLKDRVYRPV